MLFNPSLQLDPYVARDPEPRVHVEPHATIKYKVIENLKIDNVFEITKQNTYSQMRQEEEKSWTR